MPKRLGVYLVGVFWMIAATGTTASMLADLPQFDDLDLSPDGEHLLMIQAGDNVYNLVVRDLSSGEDLTLFEGGGEAGLINWCRWGNPSRVICSVRYYVPAPKLGQIAYTRMFAVNIDGTEHISLIPKAKNRDRWPQVWNAQVQDRVVSWLVEEPENILVQLNRDARNRPSVYRLNIYTNRLSRVQRPRSMIRRWYSTYEGNIQLAIGYRNDSDPIVYHVDGRQLTEYKQPAYDSEVPPQPLGFSSDGEHVFLSMPNGQDRHAIYRVMLETGEIVEEIYRDDQFDVFGGIIAHPDSGQPVGVSYLRHHPKLVWFDDRLEALFARMLEKLPGEHMRFISADRGYDRFVLYNYGGAAPRYYLYDRTKDEVAHIGDDFPGLGDDVIRDLTPVEYTTRDGLTIPAYLAQPDGEGPFPTILLPHGGPYARDSAEFDPWTQFLVEKGFAVLKPNYRGSVGYGEAYMQAGYKQWGLKMQEDLMDGLGWLVDQGVADPERVCVVGASYGGYTALVSAFKFSDRIDCAVSLAGISDLEKMVQRLYNFDLATRNRERIQDARDLAANSPIRQAERFRVPVLMLHGDRDTVVRVNQSRKMARLLDKLGKNFRYVEQPEGDHFLSLQSQREEFFEEMGGFLQTHIGN